MARHAQPREVAELKGAHKHDPQRYKGEVPKSDFPLGNPPEHLTEMGKKCWFELASYAIPGVMTYADSIPFELAVELLAEYREDRRKFPVGKYTHLIGLCARFGMTPADRNKLVVEKPNEEDEFEVL